MALNNWYCETICFYRALVFTDFMIQLNNKYWCQSQSIELSGSFLLHQSKNLLNIVQGHFKHLTSLTAIIYNKESCIIITATHLLLQLAGMPLPPQKQTEKLDRRQHIWHNLFFFKWNNKQNKLTILCICLFVSVAIHYLYEF